MSLKSFVKSVVSDITALINKILPTAKTDLDVALVICNGIKTFTDSPVADVVAALIPGTIDDTILAKVRQCLPSVMVNLKLADAEAGKSADDIVRDGISTIKSMEANTKSVTLQSVWKLLSNELTGDEVPLADLQKIAQSYYEEYGAKAA